MLLQDPEEAYQRQCSFFSGGMKCNKLFFYLVGDVPACPSPLGLSNLHWCGWVLIFIGFISHSLTRICLVKTSNTSCSSGLIKMTPSTWCIHVMFCRMSRWSRGFPIMIEGGKVNIALEQDHPCLPLSSPQKCKLLEMEKKSIYQIHGHMPYARRKAITLGKAAIIEAFAWLSDLLSFTMIHPVLLEARLVN